MGAARVSIPVTSVMAAAWGVKQAGIHKGERNHKRPAGRDRFKEFAGLVKLDEQDLESRYLTEKR